MRPSRRFIELPGEPDIDRELQSVPYSQVGEEDIVLHDVTIPSNHAWVPGRAIEFGMAGGWRVFAAAGEEVDQCRFY